MEDAIIIISSDEETCASNSNLGSYSAIPSTSYAQISVPCSPLAVAGCSSRGDNNFCNGDEGQLPPCESRAFAKFIDACKSVNKDGVQGLKIINSVILKYEEVDSLHKSSDTLVNFIGEMEQKVIQNPDIIYVHLKNVKDELERYRRRNKLTSCIELRSDCQSNSTTVQDDSKKSAKREKHIRRLERLLRLLDRKIKKLQETEISVDDLDNDDSVYLQEERYKKRFMKVWNKLCELKRCQQSAGCYMDKRFVYEGTRYPEINKKISKYINKYKTFPDFADVQELITNVNVRNSLHMPLEQIKDTAQKVFEDVGSELRKRRILDFNEMLELPDDAVDPALEDNDLASILDESRQKGKQRIDQVLEEFTQKQYAMTPEEKNIDDAQACEDETRDSAENFNKNDDAASQQSEESTIQDTIQEFQEDCKKLEIKKLHNQVDKDEDIDAVTNNEISSDNDDDDDHSVADSDSSTKIHPNSNITIKVEKNQPSDVMLSIAPKIENDHADNSCNLFHIISKGVKRCNEDLNHGNYTKRPRVEEIITLD